MYWITQFGTRLLPARQESQSVGAGRINNHGILNVAGDYIYDTHGDEQLKMGSREIVVRGVLYNATAATLESDYQDLMALIGERDQLYRVWDDGGATQTIYARCTAVEVDRDIRHKQHLDLTMRFRTAEGAWCSASASTESGTFNAGTIGAGTWQGTLTNSGNAIQRDVTLDVVAGTATLNYVQLYNSTTGHVSKIQAGTAVVGTLTIDSGTLGVSADGTSLYSSFRYESEHEIDDWIRLAPGDNVVQLYRNGGGTDTSFTFTWYDAWA